MKQVLQHLDSGETRVEEIPCPQVGRGQVLIRTRASLISAGTERMLVAFGRAGLLDKARQQPDRVRQLLRKVRTDGLAATVEAVKGKLAQPIPLGYSNAGVVLEVGEDVDDMRPGDRVVSNGPHAEIVCVPRGLCVPIPDEVDDASAAFAVVGAIALQGIRLAAPTFGERFAVSGLGLVGLLAAQLLRANGCGVLGIDVTAARLALAKELGIEHTTAPGEDAFSCAARWTSDLGLDGVLIAASTRSNEPVKTAAQLCRQRGRIVLVGVVGLHLDRADFYAKELSFQVSSSYGPGRYDPTYEEDGIDYPFGLVRWTERRNLDAVLRAMAAGQLQTLPLVSQRVPIACATEAYDQLTSGGAPLGILLTYPDAPSAARTVPGASSVRRPAREPGHGVSVGLGAVGAGSFASGVLLPAFLRAGAAPQVVASRAGTSAAIAARRFGFNEATTDASRAIEAANVEAVVIATRHDSHARYVIAALDAGKPVFVEKPLALTLSELDGIQAALRPDSLLAVGFNRRFAPLVVRARELLGDLGPRHMTMTVNAGALPADHWLHDPSIGGGRLLGEGCHFVDLLRHFAGAPITGASAITLGGAHPRDSWTVSLTFDDGSIGALHYVSQGHRAIPKERLEICVEGRTLILDNYRRLIGHGWQGVRQRAWRQDKGHRACAAAFLDAVRYGTAPPIPHEQLLEVTRVCIELA